MSQTPTVGQSGPLADALTRWLTALSLVQTAEFLIQREADVSAAVALIGADAASVNSTFAALAWTKCSGESVYGGSDSAHTRWCSPQDFYYNTYYAASYYPTDAKKRYIACHELGHTFGLQHPKTSEPQATCMVSARMGSNPYVPTYSYISTTEKNQISLYYGSGQVSI